MNRQLIRLVLDTIGEKITQEEFNLVKDALENYEELSDRDLFLACLEGCGVDNWSGYSDAYEQYNEFKINE